MILLQYPQILKDIGFSTDYEVVELNTTTSDGHRLVTLRLRTSPEVKGRDREDCTFVFDADDLFVVRSDALRRTSQDGRSMADTSTTIRTAARSFGRHRRRARSNPAEAVGPSDWRWTECRFGPIPESEFAPEPFLARLEPGGIIRKQVEEPSTATLLDWYWLAFVGGGISLAGGSGLALGSRYRDRRALRAD